MIKLLKSGSWAVEGTRVVEMVEGAETSFGPADDFALVQAGWAEWVKVQPPAEVEAEADTSALADIVAEVTAEEPARKPKAK